MSTDLNTVLCLPFYIIDRLSYLSSCLSFNFISFKPLFFWRLIFLVFVYLPNVDLYKFSTASIIHRSPDSLFISVFLLLQCFVKKAYETAINTKKIKRPCHVKLTLLPFSNNNMYLHQYISCTVLSCNIIRSWSCCYIFNSVQIQIFKSPCLSFHVQMKFANNLTCIVLLIIPGSEQILTSELK